MRLLRFVEKALYALSRGTSRCAAFLAYIRIGKGHGYPICCVIHFAWDVVHQRPPGLLRGGIAYPDGRDTVYVPCGLHKGRHPNWSPHRGFSSRQLILFKETDEQALERELIERQRILREQRRRRMWQEMYRNPN